MEFTKEALARILYAGRPELPEILATFERADAQERKSKCLPRLTDEDVDELARREELKRSQWIEESSSCMEDAHMEQEKYL